MEHIVQVAFNFDDATVTQHLMKTVEKKVEDDIRTAIIDAVLEKRGDWFKNSHAEFGDPLKDWAKNDIKKFLEENKDAIVEKAALAYAEYLKSSRAVRDKVIEKVNKEI